MYKKLISLFFGNIDCFKKIPTKNAASACKFVFKTFIVRINNDRTVVFTEKVGKNETAYIHIGDPLAYLIASTEAKGTKEHEEYIDKLESALAKVNVVEDVKDEEEIEEYKGVKI